MRPSPRLALWLVLLGFAALLLAQGVCTQEDAFISFRYARNLVDGHGLVFNPGERVEGYTNFLWTVLLAGVMALGGDPVPWSRGLGAAAALALLLLAGRRAARDGGPAAGVLAVALAASVPGLAAEAVQGLETVPFALLVAAGAWAWQDACRAWRTAAGDAAAPDAALVAAPAAGRSAARFAVPAALFLWLAALTRPEGLGAAGLCWLGCLAATRGAPPAVRRAVRRGATAVLAAVLLLYLPYWLWRFHYYGDLLPNTFYAKATGGSLPVIVGHGLAYLGRFLAGQPVLAVALAGGALLARRARRRAADGAREMAAAAAPVPWLLAGYAAYVVLVGGDFKETFRFLLPLVAPAAVLAAPPLARWWTAAPARRRWTGAAVLLAAAVNLAPLLRPTVRWSRQRALDLRRRTACGAWLRDHVRPDAVLAIHSVGIVPYVSGLTTIDMWGLNDRHIARLPMVRGGRGRRPGHAKQDDRYVLDRRPDLYVPFAWQMVTADPHGPPLDVWFPDLPDWRERQRHWRVVSAPLPPDPADPLRPRWFHFLLRRDSDALLSGSPPR